MACSFFHLSPDPLDCDFEYAILALLIETDELTRPKHILTEPTQNGFVEPYNSDSERQTLPRNSLKTLEIRHITLV